MRVTAITGNTLLKLVSRQGPHELSEYSLADIHPSLSAIAHPGADASDFWEAFSLEEFKSKNPELPLPNCIHTSSWPDRKFSRTVVLRYISALALAE